MKNGREMDKDGRRKESVEIDVVKNNRSVGVEKEKRLGRIGAEPSLRVKRVAMQSRACSMTRVATQGGAAIRTSGGVRIDAGCGRESRRKGNAGDRHSGKIPVNERELSQTERVV